MSHRTIKEKDEHDEAYYHLLLLATNDVGLKNLFKLSSFSFTEGFYSKPRLDDELLAEYNEGIIATSACLGSATSQLILKGEKAKAEKILLHHAEIFKDRFLIELQAHKGEQQIVNQILIEFAGKHNLPLLFTNDCHFMEHNHKDIHEHALCIATNAHMYDEKRFSFGDLDVHFASGNVMAEWANRLNFPQEVISNSVAVADSIDSHLYFNDMINKWPHYEGLPEDMSSWEALENISKNNLHAKFHGKIPQEYKDRLNRELKLLKKLDFSDYLLIQMEFIELANKNKCITGPGRGSAAGLLTAYCLGITDVDPIKYGLLAERFANEGRSSIPKIF